MNWEEIKEKYPKPFEKFSKWYWREMKFEMLENGTLYFEQVFDGGKSYATTTISVKDIVKSRRWYDFFDEQGIYIEIYVLEINDDFTASDWQYDIANESNMIEDIDYPTRTEAEEQAFIQAFEILENKLKEK
jgi:hypothetical protein